MSRVGFLTYKCRSCGSTYQNTSAPDLQLALVCILGGFPLPKEWGALKPGLLDIHQCEPGKKYGVADLIGGELEPHLDTKS